MPAPIHLHPTAPLAGRVLLPGDPGRALLLAQSLLEQPRMFNHNRGLWGYTGTAPDGEPVTIQSTGMGGPSAAIVITELVALGARSLLRVGTCGGLAPTLELGELLIATAAIPADGTSRALGDRHLRTPKGPLQISLRAAIDDTGRDAIVASTDLFYEHDDGRERDFVEQGAVAVEMETATLFTLAERLSDRETDVQAASLLIVTDLLRPRRARIAPDALRSAERRMGEVALRALTSA